MLDALLVPLVFEVVLYAESLPVPEWWSLFGIAVAGAGDVDLDGVEDVIVGDGRDWPNERNGRVLLYSGASGDVLTSHVGDSGHGGLGHTVAGPGDLDGDGVPDLLAGDPGREPKLSALDGDAAYVRAFSGGEERELYTLYVEEDAFKFWWRSSGVGPALSGVGDWDRDGFNDFAVGSSLATVQAMRGGVVRVHSGVSGAELATFAGDRPYGGFGSTVLGVGDVDTDGWCDLAIGAVSTTYRPPAGVVHLVSGRTGETAWSTPHPDGSWSFGWSLAAHGDVDADGVGVLLVGAPFAWGEEGRAGVWALGLDAGDVTAQWPSPQPVSGGADGFGSFVGSLPDLDGDGRADVLIGGGGVGAHAAGSGVPKRIWSREFGELGWAELKVGSVLGDLSGDGIPDFVVGGACVRSDFDNDFAALVSGADGRRLSLLRPIYD